MEVFIRFTFDLKLVHITHLVYGIYIDMNIQIPVLFTSNRIYVEHAKGPLKIFNNALTLTIHERFLDNFSLFST